ncbi:hypothetical protein NC652_004801 [Populus alba x Populus x berolinensis]|nr:hypothetical protein NC652_004801 [Populus alba x Populus x berolinensis]
MGRAGPPARPATGQVVAWPSKSNTRATSQMKGRHPFHLALLFSLGFAFSLLLSSLLSRFFEMKAEDDGDAGGQRSIGAVMVVSNGVGHYIQWINVSAFNGRAVAEEEDEPTVASPKQLRFPIPKASFNLSLTVGFDSGEELYKRSSFTECPRRKEARSGFSRMLGNEDVDMTSSERELDMNTDVQYESEPDDVVRLQSNVAADHDAGVNNSELQPSGKKNVAGKMGLQFLEGLPTHG